MSNNGTNTLANLNWWGTNNITNQYEDVGENLNLTTWNVLHLSTNELNTTCNASKNCNIGEIINLTYKLETNDYSYHDSSLLPYFEVTVLSSLGDNITADIRKYGLSILVCANNSSNIDSNLDNYTYHYIRTASDDEDVILELLMEKSEEITPGPVPDPEPVNPIPIPDPDPIDPNPIPSPDPVDPNKKPTETNKNSEVTKVRAGMKKTEMPVTPIIAMISIIE